MPLFAADLGAGPAAVGMINGAFMLSAGLLSMWLRERRIDTVTVAGYMTHNCDLSTVVDGMHRGFKFELLSDATGSLPYANTAGCATAEEIHRVVTVVLQVRFAAVLTTGARLALLASGAEAERDSIFASNQRARQL